VSKNVAVFVDVANIFYAAKAAGIDIDYVTLLKSATANRDFVRAYAYTGLDPENENQRQFHAFLARSGYKVVSKDIRKYGDGRIKANLDIELVVDMMRMAEKLDIAVVVSGDGDFAPAISAVQQKGVRVEVISFRGNTSSDLIDVADVFIDIAGVAKVEKGARSGRRVATDGDLSMTEVPDKESGVNPRRRRRRGESEDRSERSERGSRRRRSSKSSTDEAMVAASADLAATDSGSAGLVALPGEKLSRGASADEAPAEVPAEGETTERSESETAGEEGRRRRRRRGGRGRGRGGRGETAPETDDVDEGAPEPASQPDEVPTLPQHAGFGSVWDSQIGVPADTAPTASADRETFDDDDFDGEPEVPEYLLAEKKGRRRGGRARGGRSGGGYRSAIERERYGGGGGTSYSRGGRGRAGRSSGQPRASAQAMEPIEQTPGGDPWSEVPPEVQELLRAEMARRGGAGEAPESEATTSADEAPEEQPRKKTTRRRTTKKSTADAAEADAAVEVTDEPAAAETDAPEEQPKKKTTRRRTTKQSPDESAAAAEAEEKPKQTTRRRSTKKATDTAETEADEAKADDAAAEEQPKKKTTRKRTTKKAAAEPEADAPAEEV
jgi:uncharacterized LabA/DUF88 family protein